MWPQRMRVPVLVLTLAAALPAALVTGTATAAPPGATASTRLVSAVRTPVLVRVAAASHPGYDRVVFTFANGLPRTRRAAYVPRLISDGEGAPVRLAGSAVLQVTMTGADAHDTAGRPTAQGRLVPGLPNVVEIAQSGDFEAVVGYGIGLARRQPFRMFTLTRPSRVVVDIRKDYAQVTRTVTFLDLPRSTTAFRTRTVARVVPASSQATALLDHLVAGPTVAERLRGLRVVRSGVGDIDRVRVDRAKVARLRLLGGCSSGGSTFTIADLIRPTLKRLSSVDFVKIYDPAGRTERGTGRSDSIPTCLEP